MIGTSKCIVDHGGFRYIDVINVKSPNPRTYYQVYFRNEKNLTQCSKEFKEEKMARAYFDNLKCSEHWGEIYYTEKEDV